MRWIKGGLCQILEYSQLQIFITSVVSMLRMYQYTLAVHLVLLRSLCKHNNTALTFLMSNTFNKSGQMRRLRKKTRWMFFRKSCCLRSEKVTDVRVTDMVVIMHSIRHTWNTIFCFYQATSSSAAFVSIHVSLSKLRISFMINEFLYLTGLISL